MTIAFIPVRGGSKGIPNKNSRLFCGKPLLYWVTAQASQCEAIDQVIISTESDMIWDAIQTYQLPKVSRHYRTQESATDEASTEHVLLEYLQSVDQPLDTLLVLMQATVPFVVADDLSGALSKISSNSVDSILSVSPSYRLFWNEDGTPQNYNHLAHQRRQDRAPLWMENGAFYISSIGRILSSSSRVSGQIQLYECPEFYGVDLDTEDDWFYGEYLMTTYRKP